MTFNELINQLQSEIEIAKQLHEDSKHPSKSEFKKEYFFLLFQLITKQNVIEAENKLDYLQKFLDDYNINRDEETDGLEELIFKTRKS